jgi:hypothetical protein
MLKANLIRAIGINAQLYPVRNADISYNERELNDASSFRTRNRKVKKDILTLGAMAELSVREATLAIRNRDGALAQNVIEKDIRIDETDRVLGSYSLNLTTSRAHSRPRD